MHIVAPHAGAWIETYTATSYGYELQVAPHAGAWIETYDGLKLIFDYLGRAPRGRVD